MMRASVVVAIVAALVAPMDAQRPLPTADELAARVRAYLVDYETQLSMLVADEAMEQFVEMNLSHRARRRLRSEVVFMRLPGDSSWLAHRAVVTVDGQAAGAGRARLMELLSASGVPDLDKARLMVAEAQSYNLGLSRTINVPTIALDLLHPRHAERFTYALLESGSRAGRPAVRMRFNERLPGAIVQSNSREAVRTEVDAWIDLERGAVLDATVDTFEGDSTQVVVRVRVRFSRSAAVDLLVPQRMDEAFQPEGRGSATYSNYRRFSTAGRIVPKGMDRH